MDLFFDYNYSAMIPSRHFSLSELGQGVRCSLCLHNNAPDLFKEYFVKTSHNYSTRRNGLDILVPNVSTESAKKGCYYFGAQVFNN